MLYQLSVARFHFKRGFRNRLLCLMRQAAPGEAPALCATLFLSILLCPLPPTPPTHPRSGRRIGSAASPCSTPRPSCRACALSWGWATRSSCSATRLSRVSRGLTWRPVSLKRRRPSPSCSSFRENLDRVRSTWQQSQSQAPGAPGGWGWGRGKEEGSLYHLVGVGTGGAGQRCCLRTATLGTVLLRVLQ